MGFVNGNNGDHGDIWYMVDDKFTYEIIWIICWDVVCGDMGLAWDIMGYMYITNQQLSEYIIRQIQQNKSGVWIILPINSL